MTSKTAFRDLPFSLVCLDWQKMAWFQQNEHILPRDRPDSETRYKHRRYPQHSCYRNGTLSERAWANRAGTRARGRRGSLPENSSNLKSPCSSGNMFRLEWFQMERIFVSVLNVCAGGSPTVEGQGKCYSCGRWGARVYSSHDVCAAWTGSRRPRGGRRCHGEDSSG